MNAIHHAVSLPRGSTATKTKDVMVYLRQFDVAFQIPKCNSEGFLANPMNENAFYLPAIINYRIRTHNGLLIVITGSIQGDPAEDLLRRVIIPVVQCFDQRFGYKIIDQRPTTRSDVWGIQGAL